MSTLDVADSPGEMEQTLNNAFKKIADLLVDIELKSNELKKGFPADHPQVPFPGVNQLAGDLTGR